MLIASQQREVNYSFLTVISICLSLSSKVCNFSYSSSLRDLEKASFAVCETIVQHLISAEGTLCLV